MSHGANVPDQLDAPPGLMTLIRLLEVTSISLVTVRAFCTATATTLSLRCPTLQGLSDVNALGINNAGQIVGSYSSAGGTHGFIYSNGIYTTLDDPLGWSTVAAGINKVGQVVGDYVDSSNSYHIFLYSNGVYTTIDLSGTINPKPIPERCCAGSHSDA